MDRAEPRSLGSGLAAAGAMEGGMEDAGAANRQELEHNRWALLEEVQEWLETPMILLGFVWLVLLLVELTSGLGPLLQTVSNVIWGLFILDFLLRFALAPAKLPFLRANVLTMVSLLLPAFRLFRIARAFRAARGLRLVRILGSINRGMQSVRRTMRRRGFSYVLALSALVLLVGAAGMLTFERDVGGFANYGEALWWTAMLMISLGSDYWPKTAEGRILCFVLSLYGFGLFGYVTATLSSLFIGRDAEHEEGEIASAAAVAALHEEIRTLRAEIGRLRPRGRD